MKYDQWIRDKSKAKEFSGIQGAALGSHLFPHQRDLVSWVLRRGRAAIFADTGLGKTAMQIEWARHVSERGRVLILAPLAVAEQTEKESDRFGVSCPYRRSDEGDRICITNYEMLDKFDPGDFVGVVLDESSILKSYTGAFRNLVIDSFQDTPFRLACTATPAPNDHTELGNHSEFLGIKSRVEMLAEYFVHDGGSTQNWRLKGHAEEVFWRWVCSWGAMVKKPSDLGHDNGRFDLPPLRMHEHVIRVNHSDAHKAGMLFAPEASTLSEQRKIRRATIDRRVEKAVEICGSDGPALVWCELNDESAEISKAIPDAVEVKGSDSPDVKKDRLLGFAEGRYRVLVTKPSIAGFGMNWQHCNRMIFAGASHSFEQTYQAIRRCWRFGQKREVHAHIIRAETEGAIVRNYRRKEADAERLAEGMMQHMRVVMRDEISSSAREWNEYDPQVQMIVPDWAGREDS